MPTRDLNGRVLIVTGASSGIGAATALQAAQSGMRLVLAARRKERLQQVADQIRGLGREAEIACCDVCDPCHLDDCANVAIRRWGRIDALFANAGYGLYATVEGTTDEQYRTIFEVNFMGTVRAIRSVLPQMRKQRDGHILVCSSAASEVSPPLMGAYSATKAAQDAIASSLRAELSQSGIWVTSVHPMPTTTEFFDSAKVASGNPRTVPAAPVRLRQTPEHVAKCVIRALRKPCAEVWPHWPTRLGSGIATAFPSLPANAMASYYRKIQADGTANPQPSPSAESAPT